MGQDVKRLLPDPGHLLVKGEAVLFDEKANEQRDVLAPLRQQRQGNGHHVEPEKQILAETALFHLMLQILVGCGNDPDVEFNGFGAADPEDLAFLENVQQLDLHGQRHLANLIKKHGPAGGRFKQADLGRRGPGEGAAFIAKQLAVDQFVGEAAAVERHEGLVLPRAQLMDGPRRQRLARAAAALHQHVAVHRRHLADQGEQLLDDRAVADD